MKERKIDTTDGIVLCKYAYDVNTSSEYIEFYIKDGFDEEVFPYTFVGETNMTKGFDEYTDNELEDLYYESV